ncbi:hypothetical protein [Mesorhizobium sp. B3-1-6]|nr:hypothetical protein [Mesorhizobium sp. B3-1-6]
MDIGRMNKAKCHFEELSSPEQEAQAKADIKAKAPHRHDER